VEFASEVSSLFHSTLLSHLTIKREHQLYYLTVLLTSFGPANSPRVGFHLFLCPRSLDPSDLQHPIDPPVAPLAYSCGMGTHVCSSVPSTLAG
jgi:hypothetical protein